MYFSDVTIVGGGIIGLATAYQLVRRFPGKRVVILEKEDRVAEHQTGRNSGVLHSGIYYKPGSLKAANCREGKREMEAFCEAEDIPYEICGKVIVAVDDAEVSRMEGILARGQENGVRCELIGQDRLRELEPNSAGVAAIHVPETGIVNYRSVCRRLVEIVEEGGGKLVTGVKVIGMKRRSSSVILESSDGEWESEMVVNCAGLYSDRVTAMSEKAEVRIIPFRGEYFELKPEAHHLCRNLIYPVPDPAFPFLGVHFTRTINGSVECGPNAVLALAREGYRKTDVNFGELWETLTYPALWKITTRYWRVAAGEMWRSLSKRAFVRALQRLVPDIRSEHLEPAPAGIRAQALEPDGTLVDDFFIQQSERVINVSNAPSPAATASLNIGHLIVERLPL